MKSLKNVLIPLLLTIVVAPSAIAAEATKPVKKIPEQEIIKAADCLGTVFLASEPIATVWRTSTAPNLRKFTLLTGTDHPDASFISMRIGFRMGTISALATVRKVPVETIADEVIANSCKSFIKQDK